MSHGTTMKYHRLTILALLLLFELPRHRVSAILEDAAVNPVLHDPERSLVDGFIDGCPGFDHQDYDLCPPELFCSPWTEISCRDCGDWHCYCHKVGLDTAADEATPASFGKGIEDFGKTDITRYPIKNNGQISWVVELNGIGLGLCDSARHEFHVWNTVNGTGIDNLRSVALAPLSTPVGAIHSQVDPHLVYIACFGSFPTPKSDSGIAIVDISNIEKPVLVRTVAYPHPQMHVHNVYEFDFWQGGAVFSEITVAVLGNPWLKPALAGHGLVQLDRQTGKFRPPLVVNEEEGDGTNRLNVRSAKQQSPGIFYAVTQEPPGIATQVVRLEQTIPVPNTHELRIVARSVLPARNGGDGGADVVLGKIPNTVWISDRWNQAGRLYFYQYDPSTVSYGDGTFDLVATHVATGGEGVGARYTMIRSNGDIVVCNDKSDTLTVMKGLAYNPQPNPEVVMIKTVPSVWFFLESTLLPSSSVALPIASPIANQKKTFKKSKK